VEKLFENYHKKESFKQDIYDILKGICVFSSEEEGGSNGFQVVTHSEDEDDIAGSSSEAKPLSDASEEDASSSQALDVFEEEEDDSAVKHSHVVEIASKLHDMEDGELESDGSQIESEEDSEDEERPYVDDVDVPETSSGKEVVVDDALIDSRTEQICRYFTLKHNQDVATVFYDLKESLKLQGNFSYLDIVLVSKRCYVILKFKVFK